MGTSIFLHDYVQHVRDIVIVAVLSILLALFNIDAHNPWLNMPSG